MGPYDTKLRDLLHGEAIVSPYPKIISSIIKQSEYFDEEILKKANNTLDEFDTALKSFNLASQLFCMHFNISSISYHHLELYNLLSNVKIKPNIIGIFETRLQMGKQLALGNGHRFNFKILTAFRETSNILYFFR